MSPDASGQISWLVFNSAAIPHRTGLEFSRRLTFDGWQDVGRQLSRIVEMSAWWLGDWLNYGHDHYTGRYRAAVERTALDYQTLRNYAWVARRFSVSRRRDTLSFAHHAEVASLPEPEQDYWLRMAEQSGWSRNALRRQLRASREDRQPAPAPDGDPARRLPESTQMLALRISPEQFEALRQAASSQDSDVDEWAVGVLYEQARRTLALELPGDE